jgi:hypothetical protein
MTTTAPSANPSISFRIIVTFMVIAAKIICR